MKYKINGLVTIEEGIAQAEDLVIDSPIVELEPSTISNEGISFGVLYTYNQGSLERKLSLNHTIPMADLNTAELEAVQNIITQAYGRLLQMYPEAELLT